MVLAQAQEIANAASKELSRAAEHGFAAYMAVLLLVLFALFVGIHFFFVVRPDQRQRLESRKTQDECLTTFAKNYAVQTQLLNQIDAKLTSINGDVPAMKCRLLNPPTHGEKIPPQAPFTLQPTGSV
jgi:Tfp pilus assembly protein PilO